MPRRGKTWATSSTDQGTDIDMIKLKRWMSSHCTVLKSVAHKTFTTNSIDVTVLQRSVNEFFLWPTDVFLKCFIFLPAPPMKEKDKRFVRSQDGTNIHSSATSHHQNSHKSLQFAGLFYIYFCCLVELAFQGGLIGCPIVERD